MWLLKMCSGNLFIIKGLKCKFIKEKELDIGRGRVAHSLRESEGQTTLSCPYGYVNILHQTYTIHSSKNNKIGREQNIVGHTGLRLEG